MPQKWERPPCSCPLLLKPHCYKSAISCSRQARSWYCSTKTHSESSCGPTIFTLTLTGRAAPHGRATSTRSLPKSAAPGKKWLLLADPMGRDFCFKSFPQVSRILRSGDAAESSTAPVTHTLQRLCKHAFAWCFTVSFPTSSDSLCDSAERNISSRASVLTVTADDQDT